MVIEVSNSVSQQQIDLLQRRHRLLRVQSQRSELAGLTIFRWRIPDPRSVATVVRALEADRVVTSAQPNYLFTLQQTDTSSEAKTEAVATEAKPEAPASAEAKVEPANIEAKVESTNTEAKPEAARCVTCQGKAESAR